MKRIEMTLCLWLAAVTAMLVIMATLAFKCMQRIDNILETIKATQAEIQADNSTLKAELSALYAEMDKRFNEVEHWEEITDIRLKNHYGEITESKDKIEKIEKQKQAEPKKEISRRSRMNISEADIRRIASLVYLECGNSGYRCQQAVASVIINRMKRYHKTARQVIYEDGVFSPAYKVAYTRPSSSCLRAVRSVINNGSILPQKVVAFRNNHYHSFGRPYCRIDNVYFSAM